MFSSETDLSFDNNAGLERSQANRKRNPGETQTNMYQPPAPEWSPTSKAMKKLKMVIAPPKPPTFEWLNSEFGRFLELIE